MHRLADVLELKAVDIPEGARAAYHAGANLAASLLLITLREAIQLWVAVGFSHESALAALLPLAQRALETAERNGVDDSLSGPIRRGDVGMVARHLNAIARAHPTAVGLYKGLGRRQWLAVSGSAAQPSPAEDMCRLLDVNDLTGLRL